MTECLNCNRKRMICLISFTLAFLVLSCGQNSNKETGKLKVVTSIGMLADAVKIITSDSVEVTGLMGPGVDPHLYKATSGDVSLLDRADLIVYNGLNLEAKMADIFEKMSVSKRTIAAAHSIDSSLLRYAKEFKGHPDPHVWFDVSKWKTVVAATGVVLMEMDSANKNVYQANLLGYLHVLDELHMWVKTQMATIPEDKRILVTAHDAFGYFGQAYGIEVKGLQGISTVTEAGLYDVTHMIDVLVERNINAVFVESSVPRKAIEAVVEGCRQRGLEIEIGGELFSDAMGEEGTPEGTYIGMVRHNVNTIVRALSK